MKRATSIFQIISKRTGKELNNSGNSCNFRTAIPNGAFSPEYVLSWMNLIISISEDQRSSFHLVDIILLDSR